MFTIQVQHVSKTFKNKNTSLKVLRDLSLDVKKGDFVSIIGPSGCGKSTLFSLICGLDTPDKGTLLVAGEVPSLTAGKVSFMPQQDLLLPWRTVLDNVCLGCEIAGLPKKQNKEKALGLLPLFGLAGFEDRYPAELSGGMKQRAALLRTILPGKEVLLLDEPFGALDALTRLRMQQWLLEVWSTFRQTVLFITHDIDEGIYLSDRVVVMSSRPGTVLLELNIDLPRPRTPELLTTAGYGKIKRTILQCL
jgi:ABC-type nitrate/sulfonate/bicarbonate transport system ATPase subunit